MDKTAFLTRVAEFQAAGFRLALINATTIMPAPALAAHGASAAAAAVAATGAAAVLGAPGPAATPAPATAGAVAPSDEETFEITWGFARGAEFETIRELIKVGDEVPSISTSFGAAFLYENEMRELFGINVTGINVDLRGAMYKTNTRVPFSHRAVRARLEASGASTPAVGKAGS